MARMRAFLFDLDGTLVDTAPDLAAAVNKLRTDRGLSILPFEALRSATGHGAPALLRKSLQKEKTDPDYEALCAEFLHNYEAAICVRSIAFSGMPEVLDELRARGLRTGVITNKSAVYASQILETLTLAPKLDLILGFDSPNCRMKPEPDSFYVASSLLGIDPVAMVYAGDSASDVASSHAAGLHCAMVSWGYNEHPLEESGPDFIAKTPADLLSWVQSFD